MLSLVEDHYEPLKRTEDAFRTVPSRRQVNRRLPNDEGFFIILHSNSREDEEISG